MACLRAIATVSLTLRWTAHSKSSPSSSTPSSNSNTAITSNVPSEFQVVQPLAVIASDTSSKASSQPLRTLKKLQAMLDETDYATESTNLTRLQTAEDYSTSRGGDDDDDDVSTVLMQQHNKQQSDYGDDMESIGVDANSSSSLWTSKDRSKYKRQQQLQSVKRAHVQESLDDGTSSGTEDVTDDGLEYTLPSLPIYLSDGEVSTEDDDGQDVKNDDRVRIEDTTNRSMNTTLSDATSQHQQYLSTPIPNTIHYIPSPPIHESPQRTTIDSSSPLNHNTSPPVFSPYPWNYFYPPPYLGPTPFPPYHTSPMQPQSQPQSTWTSTYPPHYYNYYGNSYSQPPPPPTQNLQPYPLNNQHHHQQQQHTRYPMDELHAINSHSPGPFYSAKSLVANSILPQQQQDNSQSPYFIPNSPKSNDIIPSSSHSINHSSLQEDHTAVILSQDLSSLSSSSNPVSSSLVSSLSSEGFQVQTAKSISLDSVHKIILVVSTVATLCYCAVSPRTLDTISYNIEFQKNIQRVVLAWAPSFLLILFGVIDRSENNINSMIHSFYTSFTIGYIFSFLLEILMTTFLRLCVFALWEPSIFSMTPQVPILILPWTVREYKYRPKRITLFLADFITSCIASPLIEEGTKLILLVSCVALPKNFQWRRITISNTKKRGTSKRKWICETISKDPLLSSATPNVTNINSYISHMLMISLGLKWSDATRRILMYTKPSDMHKLFYSFCRGIFPIHELCGVMTALQLAKRDVLGMNIAAWKMLLPALAIHGMANFRGMKPIFKWKSSTPWSEMQLTSFTSSSSLIQMINLNFPKLMWLIILFRVLGYCVKNYYMIGRQAIKRTTTYAGKHSAFSAELAAAEMLKRK